MYRVATEIVPGQSMDGICVGQNAGGRTYITLPNVPVAESIEDSALQSSRQTYR